MFQRPPAASHAVLLSCLTTTPGDAAGSYTTVRWAHPLARATSTSIEPRIFISVSSLRLDDCSPDAVHDPVATPVTDRAPKVIMASRSVPSRPGWFENVG